MTAMVFSDPLPHVIERWLKQREQWGADRHDELWEGVLYVAPHASLEHADLEVQIGALLRRLGRPLGLHATGSFNLGEPGDYRVPDGGLHRERPRGVYAASAALVVEILSPGDQSYAKFRFYADRGVDEVWVVDGAAQRLDVHRREADGFVEAADSGLLNVSAVALTAEIDWP